MALAATTDLLAAPELRFTDMTVAPDHLMILAEPDTVSAPCPQCHGISHRVHSHYTRTVADVPCALRAVTFQVMARRFFCDAAECPRRIFCERLSELVATYARRTDRLQHQLQALAFALGGEVGAQQAQRLHLAQPSADTLLRLIRRAPLPEPPPPRWLGVDDWAMKKGRTYGTLLVDLERHQVIDLLPDREEQTLTEWLQAHPGIEVITRDRLGAYAEAAKHGAPQATQVADRFHLLQNLSQAIQRVLERHPAVLKLPPPEAPTAVPAPPEDPASPPAATTDSPVSTGLQRQREHYQAVQALRQQGESLRSIAHRLRLGVNTVCKYTHLPHPPERQRRSTLKMIGYEAFVQEQWDAGTRDPKTLFARLQARGFPGSYPTVARYVARLRGGFPAAHAGQAPPAPSPRLTVAQAVRVLLLPSDQLTQEQQAHLAHLRQASPEVEQAYELAHRFQDMVRERQAEQLPAWLEQAEGSAIPSLRGFARGLKKDLEAVLAALRLDFSNGPVEGQVNRLKQIKRSMYGRGKLDLLKRRVMHYEASP